MTYPERSASAARCLISTAELRGWLARATPGEQVEYHRGHLVWDRSPASEITEHDRRALAKIADAALRAAEDGLVHLVQRRNGALDFSYVAIKSGCKRAAAPARTVELRAAA